MIDIREWADLRGEERMSMKEFEWREAHSYCCVCDERVDNADYDSERDCCCYCVEDEHIVPSG